MAKHLRLAVAVVFVLGAVAAAEERKAADVDKNKLVGTWEAVKGSETLPLGSTIEFGKDGKLKMTVKEGDKSQVLEGTYTVAGDSIKVTLKMGDKSHTETLKVTVSDTELVTIDEMKKKDVLKKK
jgi:uncharacterized protein (TIGR03066 family)